MENNETINNSRILVTGGTGSFGYEVVKTLIRKFTPKEIIIFSRDEKKQFNMRNYFNNKTLKFIIGDVRDKYSVNKVMKGVDLVFHAAALKQVPTCEFFPYEAIKTNIEGANNVLEAAEQNYVKKVVILSTDKAVYPINAMGMTKALMEKLMLAKARSSMGETIFCGVRYGNVMYSRGSVIPLFVEQIKKGLPITITNPKMTRFLLPLPKAIELVLFALENAENGDILVRKSSSATVENIALGLKEIFQYKNKIKIIGIREGEKIHETLVTREELIKAEEYKDYFRIKNLEVIDYDKFFREGRENLYPQDGYTSENTKQLSVEETKELLMSLDEVKKEIK